MTAFAQEVSGSRVVTLPPSAPIQIQSGGAYIIPSKPAVATAEMKVLKLLGKARGAVEHLSSQKKEEMLERIEEWEALFSGTPIDPSITEERLQIAYRMCYVHWNLEQVMIAYAYDRESQSIWEALGLELKERISEIVPEDLNPDTFRAATELKFLVHKTSLVAENLLPERREQVMQMVYDWEVEFSQATPLGPVTEDERMNAGYNLCFLQRNLEVAMLQFAQTQEEQLAWDALIVEVGRRLSDILPNDIPADAFRAVYEEGLVEQGILSILPLIEELRQRLYASVNQLSELLSAQFETVKEEMQKTHEESQLSQKRLHTKVGEMTATLTELYRDFGKRMEECKELQQRLHSIEATTNRNVSNLNNTLRKV